MNVSIANLILASLVVLAVIAIGVAVVIWRSLRRRAQRAGHASFGAYLRAVPRSDEEKRDAVDLTLQGLVICFLGPPLSAVTPHRALPVVLRCLESSSTCRWGSGLSMMPISRTREPARVRRQERGRPSAACSHHARDERRAFGGPRGPRRRPRGVRQACGPLPETALRPHPDDGP